MIKLLNTLGLLSFILVTAGSQDRTESLLTDWRFMKGPNALAHEVAFDDSQWAEVRVPHDWAIAGPFIEDGDGNTGKLPWKGEGWYRTQIDVSESVAGKTVYLIFDGVMAFPKVYVNGTLAGKWDYGYNSFYLDITNHIKAGETNLIAVHADTGPHDSRWYPGGGIYRKVTMRVVDPVHIDVWGIQISTPVIKPHYAEVIVETTIINNTDQPETVLVSQFVQSNVGTLVKYATKSVFIPANNKFTVEQSLIVDNPELWDITDPYLYSILTKVDVANTGHSDSKTTLFGIRSIRFTADHGFHLNDRRVQLKGVNLHHDLGPLGAAFNKRAAERQLEIMMDMGVNAVRTSHNTAAPELLDLCDEMGLLVFNEIFDKYDGKADIVDTTNFEDFVDRNMRNFVLRDQHHPSIFLWSVGNEIGDVQWNENRGFYRLNTMLNALEKYDRTRPNTLVCDSRESARKRHFDFYDVHAWNYGRRYDLARQLEPNKSVIISESASTLSTRGFYEFPLPKEKTDFTKSLQVSSYDLNAPWWAEVADDDFMWQQEEPYIAGEFIWTGFDYLGEPTPYNNQWTSDNGMTDREASRSSYFGVVDLCGIPKDRFYLYKSYWNPDETTVHILPHWNWAGREGDTTPVFVYTNGTCAELFLNGESLGTKCKDPLSTNSIERFRLMWNDVTYEPGELVAIAYTNYASIGTDTVRTAGGMSEIRLIPDRDTIQSGGDDLSFVLVEAIDANGNPCPLQMSRLEVQVSGEGELVAVGNGNPQSFNSFASDHVDLFYGKAMIIVKGNQTPGTASISITTDGITSSAKVIVQ